MKAKIKIIERCWEIMRAVEKYDEDTIPFEDLEGDILAYIQDILYYVIKSMDYKEIGEILKLGNEVKPDEESNNIIY